jgi:hypothetical protein
VVAFRTLLLNGFRVVTSVALLVSVATTPIRPARLFYQMVRRDCLTRNLSVLPTKSSRFASTVLTARPTRVKALPSEGEEELGKDDSPASYTAYQPAPCSCNSPGDKLAPRPVRSAHPLRC